MFLKVPVSKRRKEREKTDREIFLIEEELNEKREAMEGMRARFGSGHDIEARDIRDLTTEEILDEKNWRGEGHDCEENIIDEWEEREGGNDGN